MKRYHFINFQCRYLLHNHFKQMQLQNSESSKSPIGHYLSNQIRINSAVQVQGNVYAVPLNSATTPCGTHQVRSNNVPVFNHPTGHYYEPLTPRVTHSPCGEGAATDIKIRSELTSASSIGGTLDNRHEFRRKSLYPELPPLDFHLHQS